MNIVFVMRTAALAVVTIPLIGVGADRVSAAVKSGASRRDSSGASGCGAARKCRARA